MFPFGNPVRLRFIEGKSAVSCWIIDNIIADNIIEQSTGPRKFLSCEIEHTNPLFLGMCIPTEKLKKFRGRSLLNKSLFNSPNSDVPGSSNPCIIGLLCIIKFPAVLEFFFRSFTLQGQLCILRLNDPIAAIEQIAKRSCFLKVLQSI